MYVSNQFHAVRSLVLCIIALLHTPSASAANVKESGDLYAVLPTDTLAATPFVVHEY